MTKLALSDEILMKIDKPARYIGNELNSIKKDKEKVAIRFAMCFPDVYEIGMSHLGVQILYDMFNKMEDVWCERVYSPWPDLHKIMKEEHIPLFGLESQEPIKNLDFIGLTLNYEMCYTNVLQILDLGQIPLLAKDRTEDDPLVIGGGCCTYNPEPMADFFDLFYMGEGEISFYELFDLYKKMRAEGKTRHEFLHEASKVPGIYVPSLYEVTYKEDGTIASFEPIYEDVPKTIQKQIVLNMTEAVYPEKPVVPFIKATQDRVVLEIQRGCIRGCRFCQAGMVYRPVREKNVEHLKDLAYKMLKSTGHEEISLSSLSSSDYSELEELVNFLIDEFKGKGVNISLPSLRIDAFSLDVMSKVQDIKKSSLTFAPEAGSQRLRDVINKGLTEEVILNGSRLAFEGGWNKVKLYFMLGLPTETEEDMKAIPQLANEIAALYYDTVPKEKRNGKCQITISTSFFVPKPFTPFQWAPMGTAEYFDEKRRFLTSKVREQINQRSIRYICHDAVTSELEGIFARGDRKLSDVIEKAYKKGCIFDAWTDYFRPDVWNELLDELSVDRDFYNYRERNEDEIFPWDFIDIGVSKQFLRREYENAKQGKVTPNCKQKCSGCGAASFHAGICMMDRKASGGSAQ